MVGPVAKGPSAPAAGWYPANGSSLRWWNGSESTSEFAYPSVPPRPKRRRVRTVGWLLLGAPLLLSPLGGVAVMGDSFPTARVGVAVNNQRLQIVTVPCAGERLKQIELRRVIGPEPSSTDPILWRTEGDVVAPSEVTVGQAPRGMVETVPLTENLSLHDRLSLFVQTDQLAPSWPLEFSIDDIPATGLLGESGPAGSIEELRSSSRADAPCGDPYGDKSKGTFIYRYLIVTGSCSFAGLVMLLGTRQRRNRTDAAT